MSDALKKKYEQAGQLANFFDKNVPTDLYRRRNVGDKTPIMQPVLIGFGNPESPREPDVYLTNEKGLSPQYEGATMLREPGSKPLTRQIIEDATKYVVRGCRGPDTDFRGVSTFDMKNPFAPPNVEWFYIPEGTEIPPGLAVTADGKKFPGKPRHYTIAPKDDMPLPLFLQHLKGLAAMVKKAQD